MFQISRNALLSTSLAVTTLITATAFNQTTAAQEAPGSSIIKDGDLVKAKMPAVPAEFLNKLPAEEEAAYWKRVQTAMSFKTNPSSRTTGEGEKWGYPSNFFAYFQGQPKEALEHLQILDGHKDHGWTDGIDLYWCFTLKGQTRKFFYFKDELKPEYVKRFEGAIKKWSADDVKPGFETILLLSSEYPEVRAKAAADMKKMTGEDFGEDKAKWKEYWGNYYKRGWQVFEDYERLKNIRPHPTYGIGKGPVGGVWNPEVRGFVADARNTDNLRGMREVAVYLFAEQVGNELTRKMYKHKIRTTAMNYMAGGNGEWDSETYLAHTLSAYLNLYDYAKDPDVRGYAKAILDYLSVSAAVKYNQGTWAGPNKRDYNAIAPWSTSAASFWLYFGDTNVRPGKKDDEWPHQWMSAYRPPMAAIELARKTRNNQWEIFSTHPPYETWLPGNLDKPYNYETTYVGESFQLGSLAKGAGGDLNGMKLLFEDGKGTNHVLVTASGKNNKNVSISTNGADRRAQNKNLLINVSKARTDGDYQIFVPSGTTREVKEGVHFVKGPKAWIAIHLVNLTVDSEKKARGKKGKGSPGTQIRLKGKGGKLAGYVLEVGEKATHGSYESFADSVLKKSKLDLSKIENGMITYTDAKGKSVGIDTTPGGYPIIFRDGKQVDYTTQWPGVFHTADQSVVVDLPLGERKMTVEAGNWRFTSELKEDGSYTFKNEKIK